MKYKILTIIVFILLNHQLYAQRDIKDIKEFLRDNPSPKGSFFSIKEGLKSPEKVLYLSLIGVGLKTISPEILKFKNLIELDFSYNSLEEIPSWITKLTTLKKLSIRSNILKKFPASIFSLPSLIELDLWGNEINTFPNDLTITNTTLLELNLSHNNLNKIPDELIKLTSLKALKLEGNTIKYIPEFLFKMKNLERIYFLKNNISDFKIDTIINDKIRMIDLAFNPVATSTNKLNQLKKVLPNCEIWTDL